METYENAEKCMLAPFLKLANKLGVKMPDLQEYEPYAKAFS